jgi:hypothetical protein
MDKTHTLCNQSDIITRHEALQRKDAANRGETEQENDRGT